MLRYIGEKCFQACSFMVYMERSIESVLKKKEILTVKETSFPVSIVNRGEWL